MELLLILLVLGVVFGAGVLLVGRSRRGAAARRPTTTEAAPPAAAPPSPAAAPPSPPAAPPSPKAPSAAPPAAPPEPAAPPAVEVPVEAEEPGYTPEDLEALLADEELADLLAEAEAAGAEEAEAAEAEAEEGAGAQGALEVEAIERPRFRDRLGKARAALAGILGGVRRRKVDESTWEDLEDALISADVGVRLSGELIESLRARVRAEKIDDPDTLLAALKEEVRARLGDTDRSLRFDPQPGSPNVWLFVGVNGVGKTTSIGKVGAQQRAEGRSVVMAAGDTFRAAAAEQLETWATRAGADFVRGAEGGDPGAVIFDAVQRAAARGYDLVLGDTAGRLHTKVNLMEELRKVRRVADREPGRVTEVLLVIDATTGQNGMQQARQFTEATDVTGVVLTKLDGSAKGGIVLAIQHELGIPVKLVGLGETIGDLVAFDPDEFVDALFE